MKKFLALLISFVYLFSANAAFALRFCLKRIIQ